METQTFQSIEAMLEPSALTSTLGTNVVTVRRSPMLTEGFSDNTLERVTCHGADGTETQAVLKRFDQHDWISTLTSDVLVREISLLEGGWYARLPSSCRAPIIAAARDSSESAILMWDVSSMLFAEGDDLISEEHLEVCLKGITELHADRWGQSAPGASEVDFCSSRSWVGLLAPNVGLRRVELGIDNQITASLVQGWDIFSEVASKSAARTVAAVQHDATGLLTSLGNGPQTLIHGDLKLANLGIDTRNRLVMLDWALAGFMSPFIDLGWFLAVNSTKNPISKEATIDTYRAMLSHEGIDLGADWDRHIECGLLAGGTLRLGWAKAFGTMAEDDSTRRRETAEIEWWSELTERASRWL